MVFKINVVAPCLTLNLLTTTIVAPPSNASKWRMGFNSACKGLIEQYDFKTFGGIEVILCVRMGCMVIIASQTKSPSAD